MEDSFNVRVDRAFGSLEAAAAAASIKSTSSSSLWCLTDQEIERNEWIQHKVTSYKDKDEHVHKNPKPYSSFLQGLLAQPSTSHQDLESDLEELDDDQEPLSSKPDDHSNEEWNIRSSVGMDCTLDNEEEEDVFDKVALGNEERFYMRDVNVNDYEVEIDSNNELPNSITDVMRDPRANRMAAKIRLKEDDESVRKKMNESEKVIRQSGDVVMMDELLLPSVPDYVRNPSKYTHYTFDSMDDVDEESNRKAYMELFNSVKGLSGRDDVSANSETSVVFTPRNKSSDDGSINKNKVNMQKKKKKKVIPIVRIAAEAEAEVCVMEEDEPEVASSKSKGGRRYRTKGSGDVE
ncbi:hypothetical protein L6452_44707 [Arctium lappa]|uniref:Uncharacterized protein n=1 Tax=Arctium lappa TaxID=4217 RepID=A0ACB8XI85_ARCLA|nr:hypothetical protein L6452_44707 [Arctium lappa]